MILQLHAEELIKPYIEFGQSVLTPVVTVYNIINIRPLTPKSDKPSIIIIITHSEKHASKPTPTHTHMMGMPLHTAVTHLEACCCDKSHTLCVRLFFINGHSGALWRGNLYSLVLLLLSFVLMIFVSITITIFCA